MEQQAPTVNNIWSNMDRREQEQRLGDTLGMDVTQHDILPGEGQALESSQFELRTKLMDRVLAKVSRTLEIPNLTEDTPIPQDRVAVVAGIIHTTIESHIQEGVDRVKKPTGG